MTISSAPLNASHEPDVIVLSGESKCPAEFYLHSTVLASASPFFRDMFTLPQASHHSDGLPVIPVSEPGHVLELLFSMIYKPNYPPDIATLQDMSMVLAAAIKYDFMQETVALRKLLMTSRFLQKHPIHVYAIASRLDLDEELEAAAKETFKVNLIDGPPNEDLRYISAYDYHHLLHLHHQRTNAVRTVLKRPPNVTCMQCNSSVYNMHEPPKWWRVFEAMAREEVDIRPTTDVVFGTSFLFKAVEQSGCPGCSESLLQSWETLAEMKRRIDQLPLS